jgi:hypothetical protein
MPKIVKQRKSYTKEKMIEVIARAEEIGVGGNRKAGKEFGIDEANIRCWRGKKSIIKAITKGRRTLRFRAAYWPELEEEMKKWVMDRVVRYIYEKGEYFAKKGAKRSNYIEEFCNP